MGTYPSELACLLFDTSNYVWRDESLVPWHRAILRLSLLHLQTKLDLTDADKRPNSHLPSAVIDTLLSARSLAPTPVDALIVRWTCLFCIARPPRRKGARHNRWAEDALGTVDALATLHLLGHAEHLARSLSIKIPAVSRSPARLKPVNDVQRGLDETLREIRLPRLLAPQMRAGIGMLVRYLKAPPGGLDIVKTPVGLLMLREGLR